MLHPILSNKKGTILYFLIWSIFILGHFLILLSFNNQNKGVAFADAVIFNVVYAVLGLGIWYVVRFADFEKNNLLRILLNHLVTILVFSFIWIFSGYWLTKLTINPPDFTYSYLLNTIQMKVLTGIIFYSLLTLCYYLIMYYQNFKDKLLLETELKSQVKEAELNQLKSQIKPHFLFNSLNSISSLTITNPVKAREMIIHLSDFLRYTVGNDQKQMVSLHDEMNNIIRYLSIEKVRFGEKLEFTWHKSRGAEKLMLPNMVLQPLVENAIKHGVYQSTEKIFIDISDQIEEDNLVLNIQNNFDSDLKITTGNGVGLSNIKNRLKLIYGRNDLFQIHVDDNLFNVKIKIPQISN